MRKSKLKRKGSEHLVIENAQLLGRKGLSVQVNFGEVKVIKTEAFNPALTIDQLMKQALSRVHRVVGESDYSWQVSCEAMSFAVATEIFQPLLIDLDATAGELLCNSDVSSPIDAALADRDLARSELEDMCNQLLHGGAPGALVVVGTGELTTSMSFRLDTTTIQDKLTEIVGELTRDGSDRSKVTAKLYSEGVRSRKELGNAKPTAEFAFGSDSPKPPAPPPEPPLRALDLSERYRIGLMSWLKRTSAKLLLIDGLPQNLDPTESRLVIDYLKEHIGTERLCLIFEGGTSPEFQQLTPDQLSRYDDLQSEYRRKIGRTRVVDWMGCEAELAKLFASLPDARRGGLTERDFLRGGTRYSCPACSGEGFLHTNMGPLGEVRSVCAACSMTGFAENVLRVKFKEVSFEQILSGSLVSYAAIFSQHDLLSEVFEKFLKAGLSDLCIGDSLRFVAERQRSALLLSHL